MEIAFRYVLLMGILIIPLHFSSIDNKFPIMIGTLIGGSIAFLLGYFIIKKKKKQRNSDNKQ